VTAFVRSADGVAIAYDACGVGAPAVVLVHGWSCDRGYWSGQIEALAQRFRVVAVDLAGHGESGTDRSAWTIGAFGDDVAAVADALALANIVLVGHSMGGDVVVEAARRLAGRVAGLVWVDTYRTLGTPRSDAELEAFRSPFRTRFAEHTRSFVRGMFPPGCDPSLVERIAADMASAPPAIAIASLEALTGYEREVAAALGELKLPLVAINPETTANDVASMQRYGVEVVTMPGAGHFPMIEDAKRFNALCRGAIERIARLPQPDVKA
jgi:pimeloyl-ACP methyl ester carboxylesterase